MRGRIGNDLTLHFGPAMSKRSRILCALPLVLSMNSFGLWNGGTARAEQAHVKTFVHFTCSGRVADYSIKLIADRSIGSGDSMCYFSSQSAVGRLILTTCPVGTDDCKVIGTVKNDDDGGDWSPIITSVDDVVASRQANTDERCRVMDPTDTPLNVRTAPGGRIVGTLSNGTLVTILDRSSVGERMWAYVGRFEDRGPIGWVYREYLDCSMKATTQPSPYVVDGLALGGRVRLESEAYKEYQCAASEKFPGFTWCHKEKIEKTKRGEVTSATSILHTQEGVAAYVNRYVEPAYFGPNDVKDEIARLSARFGERAREIWMPAREGLPRAVIAVWGRIELRQLDDAEVSTVASGGRHKGLLVSFLGDLQRSAKAGVPVYELAGGAGFLWAAAFNQDGRGVLRFLTVDASQTVPPVAVQHPPPAAEPHQAPTPPSPPSAAHEEETDYGKIGWWSIAHRVVDNLSGCSATAHFMDQTTLELALVQSDAGKGWVIFISNPQWDAWIAKRSQHSLWLLTTKPWHGTFTVSGKSLFFGDGSIDFMNSLADAHLLRILTDRRELLASLDMRDSDPAIKAVVNCVREHPLKRAPTPEAETTFSGTAFFIAPDLLLTNNHVVRDCRGSIQVRYPERASHLAMIYGLDQTNDLAILHTDMANLSVAGFHVQPRLGESIATYGFPYAGILSSSGNFTLGNVSSLSGMRDDTRFLQISAPIQPGNSGGPLLDMSGNVVGVVVAQINALAMMQAGDSVPQNVNFAIQVPIVLNFLSVKGVIPKLDKSDAPQVLPASDVADRAKQFTVQVYCEGVSSEKTSGTGQQPDGGDLTGGHR
jgi:serine protease Do